MLPGETMALVVPSFDDDNVPADDMLLSEIEVRSEPLKTTVLQQQPSSLEDVGNDDDDTDDTAAQCRVPVSHSSADVDVGVKVAAVVPGGDVVGMHLSVRGEDLVQQPFTLSRAVGSLPPSTVLLNTILEHENEGDECDGALKEEIDLIELVPVSVVPASPVAVAIAAEVGDRMSETSDDSNDADDDAIAALNESLCDLSAAYHDDDDIDGDGLGTAAAAPVFGPELMHLGPHSGAGDVSIMSFDPAHCSTPVPPSSPKEAAASPPRKFAFSSSSSLSRKRSSDEAFDDDEADDGDDADGGNVDFDVDGVEVERDDDDDDDDFCGDGNDNVDNNDDVPDFNPPPPSYRPLGLSRFKHPKLTHVVKPPVVVSSSGPRFKPPGLSRSGSFAPPLLYKRVAPSE
jgi:hypothetical protein